MNLGSNFFVMHAMLIWATVQKITELFASKFQRFERCSNWLGDSLYWNGFLRIIIETYIEIFISVLINIKTSSWAEQSNLVIYSNMFSLFWLGVLIVVPIITIWYYIKHIDLWTDTIWFEKYGCWLKTLELNP